MDPILVAVFGVLAGTVAGIIPGVGITVTLVILLPILLSMDVFNLLVFYLSVAATVQYTGTIPSVFFGVPGESNSMPASIEGIKFTKKKESMLAISGCALGSLLGATIAFVLTLFLIKLISPYIKFFFSSQTKLYFYILVIAFLIFAFNRGKFFLNSLLLMIGFVLSMPGELKYSNEIRFSFGIDDMAYGIPLFPVLIAFVIVPSLFKKVSDVDTNKKLLINDTSIKKMVAFFTRHLPSAIRGSMIGYFCGFVPGVTTILATGTSYSLEKKINKNYPGKQLIAAESANNSGMLASLLPLMILAIPITSSEVILYGLLVNAGWNPFQILDPGAISKLLTDLAPYYLLINILAILAAWPLAKTLTKLLNLSYNNLIKLVFCTLVVITAYLGYLDYRLIFWLITLTILSTFGYLLRNYNCVPIVFMFIIGPDLETIIYRALI